MITKLYEQIKKIIKENFSFLLSFLILLTIFYIPLPYYIHAPGGLVDVSERFQVQDSYSSTGTFHLAYVSEYHASIPMYLFAKIKKDWEITKKEEVVASNETAEENDLRSHLLLEESNGNAILNAYRLADKFVSIKEQKLMVTYIDKEANTDLKIGDQVLKIDQQKVHTKEEVASLIGKKKKGEKLEITVLRDKSEVQVPATILEVEGTPKIGIIITSNYEFETEPGIKFNFKENESGPSGGFMMSLAIYNALVEKDITNGKKIAGTGSIDEKGNIGTIGGVEFKIKSAEKEHADIFFAPSGENYQEAKEIATKNNYHVKVVEVKTLKDAIYYLTK